MSAPRLRCAVYTRKSTEEGLEQEFNSLDAQFEACAAFITSQIGLGWHLVADRYDDGGISGGTMDRPALQRLLQDIRDRKVDVVVVYKIDRLTRSLMDFSKIVDEFDQNGASFVSVTQQFNTTTSMGRLMLNVLLSFAQFEREVTAERIRDKIAASKKKGMWMGGIVPLGYRVENRKLLINDEEADTVRWLFSRYLELKSVRALVDEAKVRGISSRNLRCRDGRVLTTRPLGRGNLYHLLSNTIYIGKIRHRDTIHSGEHEPLIEEAMFAQAQALLATQAPRRNSSTNRDGTHLLTGIVFDEAGDRLRAVHANKQGVRYRYYVSKVLVEGRKRGLDGWRLPANELDALVEQQLHRVLRNQAQLAEWIQAFAPAADLSRAVRGAAARADDLAACDAVSKRNFVQSIIRRVDLSSGKLTLSIDRAVLVAAITDAAITDPKDVDAIACIECPTSMRRRGVEMRMILTDGTAPSRAPDTALVAVIHRAQRYLARLVDGSSPSLTETAETEGVEPSEVSRLLPLAFLSPKLVDQIFTGTQPIHFTAPRLIRLSDLPTSWSEQVQLLAA